MCDCRRLYASVVVVVLMLGVVVSSQYDGFRRRSAVFISV